MSTSAVPLEDVYRPWLTANRAVQPVVQEGEENLSDGTIPEDAPDAPPRVVRQVNPFAEAVAEAPTAGGQNGGN
jgi:hypothetical protein